MLEDELASPPLKAEARQQREDILECLRENHGAAGTARRSAPGAVTMAVKRLHSNLAGATDAEGKPHRVLQELAWHLHRYLLTPSGRGGGQGGVRGFARSCFTYEPPSKG